MNVSLHAIAQDNSGDISATGAIQSSFAQASLKQATFSPNDPKGMWLKSAQIEASVPDLAKGYAMAQAFSPPAPPAKVKTKKDNSDAQAADDSPAFVVNSGSMNLTLNVAGDPSGVGSPITSLKADGLLDVPGRRQQWPGDQESRKSPCNFSRALFKRAAPKNRPGQLQRRHARLPEFPLRSHAGYAAPFASQKPAPSSVMSRSTRCLAIRSANMNPIFANSKQASGLLDVTVTNCQNLAHRDQNVQPPIPAACAWFFSISDMDIANPMGSLLLGGLLKQLKLPTAPPDNADVFAGQIKDAVVSVDQGVAKTDMTLSLIDPGDAKSSSGSPANSSAAMPLRFWGDIHLADLTQSLNATVPTALIAKFVSSLPVPGMKDPSKALAGVFPNGIPVVIKGTTTKPKFDYQDVGKQFTQGLLQNPDNLNNLLQLIPGQKQKKSKDR